MSYEMEWVLNIPQYFVVLINSSTPGIQDFYFSPIINADVINLD